MLSVLRLPRAIFTDVKSAIMRWQSTCRRPTWTDTILEMVVGWGNRFLANSDCVRCLNLPYYETALTDGALMPPLPHPSLRQWRAVALVSLLTAATRQLLMIDKTCWDRMAVALSVEWTQ